MPANFTDSVVARVSQRRDARRGDGVRGSGQHDTDGIAGPNVWQALLDATTTGGRQLPLLRLGVGHEALPEHLESGVTGRSCTRRSPTPASGRTDREGTWPVYARYVATTMSGTNPDGTTYKRSGRALGQLLPRRGRPARLQSGPATAIPRASGASSCPPPHAGVVFPFTPIGTLVTVA